MNLLPSSSARALNEFLMMVEGFASLEEVADSIAEYLPHRKRPTNFEGLRKNLRMDDDGRYRWHWDPAFVTSRRRVTGVVKRRQQVCRPRVVSPEIRHLVRVEVVLSAEDNTLGAAMVRRQGRPGSWSVACREGLPRNLGGLVASFEIYGA